MKWSDQDFESALELYRDGMSIRAIATELDIPYSTLRTRLIKPQQPGASGTEQLQLRVEQLESQIKDIKHKLEEHIQRSHLMLKQFEKAEMERKDREASEPAGTKLFSLRK